MNPATISTITGVLGLLNPLLGLAASVATSFVSDKTAVKIEDVQSKVYDATKVATAVMPLLQSFAAGNDVTEDDVKAALAGMDAALSEFDALIASKGG